MTPVSPPANERELYPISTVAELTGVSPITLRAWERRYGLIKPIRKRSGHRLYRRDDIDLIHQIVALLDKGMRIGQVRGELQAQERDGAVRDQTGPWPAYRRQMVSALIRFDEDRLDGAYNEALALHPIDAVTRHLLTPLLVELGERWQTATGSVAEEHFFSTYLRNKLGARFHHRPRRGGGRRLLAACLPGEQHEIGLLLFALSADEAGYVTVLLGADMPLLELPAAARQARCDAIVLSGSIEPEDEVLDWQLPELVRRSAVPVFVGGTSSVEACETIVDAGAEALGSDIEPGLKRLQQALPVHPGHVQ